MVRRPAHPLAHPFALLGLAFLAALLPAAGAAQHSPSETGLTDASYTSPAFGFGVRWHRSQWTADRPVSDANGDLLVLRDAKGNAVRYLGTTAFGDDARACLDAQIAALTETSGVSKIDIVIDADGTHIWSRNEAEAYGLYVYAYGGRDWLAWLDCQTLVPGSAVLAVTQVGPVDDELLALVHEQATRIVPDRRAVSTFSSPDRPPYWHWENSYCESHTLIDSGDGSPFTDAPPPDAGMTQVWYRFHWYLNEGWAGPPRQIDADAIFLVDVNDVIHRPSRFAWSDDASNANGSAVAVAPGTDAELTLLFDLPIGTVTAALYDATSTHGAPTLATPLGCEENRNGLAVRPLRSLYRTSYSRVSFVFSPEGNEQGMVVWLDSTKDAAQGSTLLLRFVNTGSDTWQFDPSDLRFENLGIGDSLIWPDAIVIGGDPAVPGRDSVVSGPLILAPGEAQILTFKFYGLSVLCGEFELMNEDQIIPLGGDDCGAGAGGAAPVIRTGE